MWRALILLAILAGCAPRASLVSAPAQLDIPTRTVFVKSQRALDPTTGQFTAGRAPQATLRRFVISMPPGRDTGRVTYAVGTPDPTEDMLVLSDETYPSEGVFTDQIQRAVARSADKDVLLYIHGYNNTFADGVLRTAQMAEDFGFNGVPVHYSWPSAGHPLAYAFDRESIMASRAGLEALIRELVRLPTREFRIVAHSVGADLLMEVLRDLAIAGRHDVLRALDGVILVSPDIDLDVFRAQATRIGALPQPFLIISSERDRALTASARLTGQTSRVGSLPDASALSDFDVIVIDVGAVSSGGDFLGHFTAATSPEAIQRIRQISTAVQTLGADDAQRPGLIPGTVIRARQATRIILGQP